MLFSFKFLCYILGGGREVKLYVNKMILFFVLLIISVSFLFIFITSPLYLAFLLIVFALLGSYLLVSCTPCVSLLILLILIIYVGAIIVIFGYVCSVSSNFVLSLRYSRYSRYGLWLAVFSVLFVIVFKVLNFTSFVLDYSQSIVQVSPGDYFFHRRFVAIFVFIAVLILVLIVVASFSFTSFSTLRGVKYRS